MSQNKLSPESLNRAQKLLLDTAEELQSILVKNKKASDLAPYSQALAGIFDSFVRIIDENDPRVAKAHYNLAETLFAIRDFDKAAEHYRWIVTHRGSKGIDFADASLKAISSRYEALQAKKLLPGQLIAKSLKSEQENDIHPSLKEWLAWVDEHISEHGKLAENFYFESNRALYASGNISKAVQRFEEFALKNQRSKYAIPSATLVVDTFVTSEAWERLHKFATTLLRIDAWADTEFAKRVYTLNVDAIYKIAEGYSTEKNHVAALEKSEEFLADYRKAKERGLKEASLPAVKATHQLFLGLAGRSAMELQQNKKALSHFSEVITLVEKSENGARALLARASIYENIYEFSSAAKDYLNYLTTDTGVKADEKTKLGLKRRALILVTLSQEDALISSVLANKNICNEDTASECDRYTALRTALTLSIDKQQAQFALEKSKKTFKENRAAWAAVALKGAEHLSFRERNSALRELVNHWDDLEPFIQMSLTASLSNSVSGAFDLNRKAMGSVAPLQGSDRYITARIHTIREYENAATVAAKLPWVRVKAEVLNNVAWIYMDFVKGLRELPTPKEIAASEVEAYKKMVFDLLMPFEEKAADVRGKAFELVTKYSVEEATFKSVSEPFFQENPSQAKVFKQNNQDSELQSLDPTALRRLDIQGKWTFLRNDCAEEAECFKYNWMRAVKEKRWPQVAYFLQKANEKNILPVRTFGLIKAVSLVAMGARAEGVIELESVRKVVTAEER